MELFIAPKLTFSPQTRVVLEFLDLDTTQLLNAVLTDMKPFDSGKYDKLTEEAINKAFHYWSCRSHDETEVREILSTLEKQLTNWLFTAVDFDILCYFYCREFRNIESLAENEFSTYYLEMDALHNEIYRSNPSHVRESLLGQRFRFFNR